MQFQDSIDNKNINIEEEKQIQYKLKKASNSFQDSEIISAGILEGSYENSHNTFNYNGEKLDISKSKTEHSFVVHEQPIYLPVFILNYCGRKKIFASNWFSSKEKANNKVEELKNYYKNNSFRYHIESEDTIIHNTTGKNKVQEKLFLSDVKNKTYNNTLLYLIGLFISSIIFLFLTIASYLMKGNSISIGYIFFVIILPIIPVLKQYFTAHIQNKFEKYNMIDIDTDYVNFDDKNVAEFNEECYKSVKAKVNVDEEGLTIYSEELDCEWFYKRKDNEILEYGGLRLLNNLPISDGECILTVVNDTSKNDIWVSSNNAWKIDIQTSF